MNSARAFFTCFSSKIVTVAKAMLVIFDFNQSKNNSIYSYGIINIIWYKVEFSLKAKILLCLFCKI
jgi:hypothetical protein